MIKVMVTGGAGYIGSHCCKELHKKGYHPVSVDNLVYGHRENAKWGDFFEGDIADRKLMTEIFSSHDIQAVIHFAAYAYVGESMNAPMKYYKNNVQKTILLLHETLKNNIRHFIFSSSCAVYGMPDTIPIAEEHSRFPISPYGRSKFMVEEILTDCSKAYPFEFMSLRYFNAAGADPEGDIGEEHDPETHLIPLILDVAADRSHGIQVFGSDYDTEDGSCIRDYIHVTDLAGAHVLALEKLMDGGSSDYINLGTGKGFSVLEAIALAKKITGKNIPYTVTDRRPGDPAILIASNQKALLELGWQPIYTNLEDIIHTAWNWHQSMT
ncbi:MAG: UDP-glucose 4-epimerase GalE [Planctomycetota bacterium]|jgi:UDP-glucose-4-epimerase GalE